MLNIIVYGGTIHWLFYWLENTTGWLKSRWNTTICLLHNATIHRYHSLHNFQILQEPNAWYKPSAVLKTRSHKIQSPRQPDVRDVWPPALFTNASHSSFPEQANHDFGLLGCNVKHVCALKVICTAITLTSTLKMEAASSPETWSTYKTVMVLIRKITAVKDCP